MSKIYFIFERTDGQLTNTCKIGKTKRDAKKRKKELPHHQRPRTTNTLVFGLEQLLNIACLSLDYLLVLICWSGFDFLDSSVLGSLRKPMNTAHSESSTNAE